MWLNYNSSPGFREKPRHAAARECYEETLGVLGSASDLAAALKSFEENNVFKVHSNPTQVTFKFSIVKTEAVPYQCKHTPLSQLGAVWY